MPTEPTNFNDEPEAQIDLPLNLEDTPDTGDLRPAKGQALARPFAIYPEPLVLDDPKATASGADVLKYWDTAKYPTVKSALDWRIAGAFEDPYEWVPANDYERFPEFEAIDNAMIREIRDQVAGMDEAGGNAPTFDGALKNILRNALIGGFVVAEKNYARYPDGRHYVKSIVPHYSFNFDIDVYGTGALGGIRWNPEGVTITGKWLQKFVVAPYPALENRNYYGESELQAVYRDAKVLDLLEEAWARGVRYLSIRPMIHWYEGTKLDADVVREIQAKLYALESGAVLSLPFSTGGTNEKPFVEKQHEIQVLEDRASAKGMESIKDMIEMLQKRINRTLGRPDHLGYTDTTTGSNAQAKTQYKVGQAEHVQDRQFIETVVNQQIIPDMIRFNFPHLPESYAYPHLSFPRRPDVSYLLELLAAGIVSKQYVAKELGLPDPPEIAEAPDTIGDAPAESDLN